MLPRAHKRAGENFCERMKNLQAVFKRSSAAASSAPIGSSGQTIATALAKATSNTTQPLQQQEMLFLLGASVREPPAMAAAWLDRIISLGKQAEAVLKMLTILHRLQLSKTPRHKCQPETSGITALLRSVRFGLPRAQRRNKNSGCQAAAGKRRSATLR